MHNNKLAKMVELAVLTAIVIFLQCFLGSIVVGSTSFSVVLVPIVIGAILLGPWAGAFLGLVFGVVVLVLGISGTDPFTHILFMEHPVGTAVICLGKGIAAGLGAGLIYRLVSKKSSMGAAFAAAAAAPILNTGLFILGGLTLVSDTLFNHFAGTDPGALIVFLVITCAGVNFLVEFAVNMILSPAIHRVITALRKR